MSANCVLGFAKRGVLTSFLAGSTVGMFPNKTRIHIDGKQYVYCNNRVPMPLIGGCLSVLGFVTFPFLLTNYMLNGSYFDKLYDQYDVDIQRYHQYDGNENKYAYPSNIHINISYRKPK
jgi:hypothetical protein